MNGLKISVVSFMLFGGSAALVAQNHLLLSEITLQPTETEFIEIFNPTGSTIILDDYYLADNQVYPYVSKGSLPALDMGDFIIRFPQGASVKSKETIVVAMNGSNFENYWGRKANFEISSGDANTPDMILIKENTATLANAGEGIALFYWNGTDITVKDVDLMNAGVPTATSVIVDKTGIAGYLPDAHTIPVQGHNGPPLIGFSTKRILLEGQNEIHSGGNGITGDDETSEDISKTWDEDFTEPNPGITQLIGSGTRPVSVPGNAIKIYPNPATSEVNLVFDARVDIYTIRIMNSGGTVVKTLTNADPALSNYDSALSNYDPAPGNMQPGGISIKIGLSEFASGVYFFVIQSDTEISFRKVVVLF
jgi:hypothetical protein